MLWKQARHGYRWEIRCARLVLILLLGGIGVANAQELPDLDHEFWPEADIWKRLSPRASLLFQWTRSKGRDYDYVEDTAGVFYDYRFTPTFAGRAGYTYILGRTTPDDREIEHRGVLDATFRRPFEESWMVSDRNRIDLRWKDSGFSYRYRNRITVEKNVPLGRRVLTLYGLVELYFDSRYSAFSRVAYQSGIQIPLNPQWTLETYLANQQDWRSAPQRVNALGTTLNLYL